MSILFWVVLSILAYCALVVGILCVFAVAERSATFNARAREAAKDRFVVPPVETLHNHRIGE